MKYPALGFDPAGGDVAAVRELATEIAASGVYASEAREALKTVQSHEDVWQGEAAQAFADELGHLPEYVGKAGTSMELAGTALTRWAGRPGQVHRCSSAHSSPRGRGLQE